MSDNQLSSKETLQNRSLVPFTEIKDVALTSLSASAPEEFHESLAVRLDIGNTAFRAREGELQVMISARVMYSDESPESGVASPEGKPAADEPIVASIDLTFRVDLSLEPSIAPDDLDIDIVGSFVDTNLIFMIYPYIRSHVQRISAEMPFPSTVLPYMRR